MTNRNAYAGRNVEHLFINSIKDHPSIVGKIQEAFSIDSRLVNAISTGIHTEKVDAKLEFACGRNVDANIKAYKDMGFNQLTRTTIKIFCKKNDFSDETVSKFETLTLNKARNVSTHWILGEEQEYFFNLLQPISREIVKWSFSSQSSREILVLYSRNKNIMHIYTMKDVLKELDYTISFTTKGNILIGKYIIIQRKGGNGVHSKDIPRDSLKHPGNNIQLKLKINPFVKDMAKIELCNYEI